MLELVLYSLWFHIYYWINRQINNEAMLIYLSMMSIVENFELGKILNWGHFVHLKSF